MKNKYLVIWLSAFLPFWASCQVSLGFTASTDLYQRYVNPDADNGSMSGSAGSTLLNLGVGPKIWFGNKKYSFSLESQGVWGIFGLSSGDYKGLGTFSVPVMAKINFKGLSTFDREGLTGFTVGGGLQWSRTELYGLSNEARNAGVTRAFFRTVVLQAGYGFGLSGFTLHGFVRYGFAPKGEGNTLNAGIQYDFNPPMLKKISGKESSL